MTDAILTRDEYAAISKESDITSEVLKECVHYDPATGIFTWRDRPREHFPTAKGWRIANSQVSGKRCNSIGKGGYRRMRMFGVCVLAHRAAWKYVHGKWPEDFIDHIDGDRDNDSIGNLREADASLNQKNAGLGRNNTSGHVGVQFCPHRPPTPWSARIYSNGKEIHLGTFAIKEDAIKARKAAELEHGFHPNHGKKRKSYVAKVHRQG